MNTNRGANLNYEARVRGGQSASAQNQRDNRGRFIPRAGYNGTRATVRTENQPQTVSQQ
jgi:hypothetical protein